MRKLNSFKANARELARSGYFYGLPPLEFELSAFRMIHEPSGQPIKYLKGVETEDGFEEVPEEEIIKGYEYTKAAPRPHRAEGT